MIQYRVGWSLGCTFSLILVCATNILVGQLPWLDDFHDYRSGFNSAHWIDARGAYLNNHLAINPPSEGYVSFDGIDSVGQRYDPQAQVMDRLISAPIDLSGYQGSSVSWFMQIEWQGRSVLSPNGSPNQQFFVEGKDRNGNWVELLRLRSSNMNPLDNFVPYSEYLDAAFLHNDFQLRFTNSGDEKNYNAMWHLDYVLIQEGQPMLATFDMAFSEASTIGLRRYEAMPIGHFLTDPDVHLSDSFVVYLYNGFPYAEKVREDRLSMIATGGVEIAGRYPYLEREPNVFEDQIHLLPGFHKFVGQWYKKEVFVSAIQQQKMEDLESVEFNFRFSQDEEEVRGAADLLRNNNSTVTLGLADVFAYDDGSSEAELLILDRGQSTFRPAFVFEYSVEIDDDIIGFEYSKPTNLHSGRDQTADVVVWIDELDDTPDYRFSDVELRGGPTFPSPMRRVLFSDLSAANVPVKQGQTLYFGIQYMQLQVGQELYLGTHAIDPMEGIEYYYERLNEQGNWRLDRRPFIGSRAAYVPIFRPVVRPTRSSLRHPIATDTVSWAVYPNPANNVVNIRFPEEYDRPMLSIQSESGEVLWRGTAESSMDISFLSSGFYFFVLEKQKDSEYIKPITIFISKK